jgi:hypothetical protein
MKRKIIDLIKERKELPLSMFKMYLPEISGNLIYYFPVKNIDKSDIVISMNVSEEFIISISELINDKVVSFKACHFFDIVFFGGEIYSLPLVKSKKLSYRNPHWLPIMIYPGENFVI